MPERSVLTCFNYQKIVTFEMLTAVLELSDTMSYVKVTYYTAVITLHEAVQSVAASHVSSITLDGLLWVIFLTLLDHLINVVTCLEYLYLNNFKQVQKHV